MNNNVSKNIESLLEKLSQLKPSPKKILLQLPEGLKREAFNIAETIESHFRNIDCEVIISAEPCYGACDLPLNSAKISGTDLIIHIGHLPFHRQIRSMTPILYFDWDFAVDIDIEKIRRECEKIKEKRIGLFSSLQYLHLLPQIEEILKKSGKEVVVVKEPVLGCYATPAEKIHTPVDAILFAGSGTFHPLGFDCKYFLNLEMREIRDISSERELAERKLWASIAKAREANIFGILVSTKPGQYELQAESSEVRKRLKQKGKKAFIAIVDEITQQKLEGLGADAYINTACPRLAEDPWNKPFINAKDLDKLIGE